MHAPPLDPVAIGGLGGSGTRVVARMLQLIGHDIGTQLNEPLDNLWFTVLFKRAVWSQRPPRDDELDTAVALFVRAMQGGLAQDLAPEEAALLAALRRELPPEGKWQCGARAVDADTLCASMQQTLPRPWGWKEPNSHVFLPALARNLPELRYIHVVRDGLDMAFSRNTWQMRHWAHLYGLVETEAAVPLRQLRYWTAANRVALDFGTRHMPGRFLVLRYEDLCDDPATQWLRLLRFLGQPEARPLPRELEVRPVSIGRAHAEALQAFPAADLAAAETLGREVARLGATDPQAQV